MMVSPPRRSHFAVVAESGRVSEERGPIQSIDRAANVLALFDEHTRTLTPNLVSERLGLNRTTAHRYLLALQGAGFLTPGYAPGPLLDQLAGLVSTRQQTLTLAPAIMRQLSAQTELTVVLSFLGRSGAVVTLVEEARDGTIVLTVRVGTMLELKAAQSRVLFAFQSDPAIVARALGELSPAEQVREQGELAKVRKERIAWADLQRTGLASVAAPVFRGDEVQAAMGVLGTSLLLTGDEGARRVAQLSEAAEYLSSLLTD
jgi:DNA-binding IclR family transcriptional regulator